MSYVRRTFLVFIPQLKTTPQLLNVICIEMSFDYNNMFQYSNTICVAYNFYSLYINLYFTATPLDYESGEVTEDIEVCEEYDDIWSSDSDGVPA